MRARDPSKGGGTRSSNRMRWTVVGAAILIGIQVPGCDSPSAPEPTPTLTPRVIMTQVQNLTPGEEGRVLGSNLDLLSSIEMDGVNVTFQVISDSEARFQVPHTRSCDVDGRSAEIVANGSIRREGAVSVRDALRLDVGESRLLDAEELACIQLSRGSERYALALQSLLTDPDRQIDRPVTLDFLNGAGDQVAQAMAQAAMSAHSLDGTHSHAHAAAPVAGDLPVAASFLSEPFDAYGTAEVGDTLNFVDWTDSAWVLAQTKDEVPTYQARVAAVHGDQMFVVDLREDRADEVFSPGPLSKLSAAAELTDQLAVSAVQAVIDPDYTAPPGAGGRIVTIIRDLGPGIGGRPLYRETIPSAWASNFSGTQLSISSVLGNMTAGGLAAVVTHELGHEVDAHAYYNGVRGRSSGWYTEAVAEAVMDAAARLAQGSEWGASRAGHDASGRGAPFRPGGASTISGAPVVWQSRSGEGGTVGAYDRGGRILRYAHSLLPEGRSWELHRHLAEASPNSYGQAGSQLHPEYWTIDRIADFLGISAEDLLKGAMLADVTEPFLTPADSEAAGLPRTGAWAYANDPAAPLRDVAAPWLVWSRGDASFSDEVEVGSGGYFVKYVDAQGAEHGASIEGRDIELQDHHRVRITRIR